MTFKKKYGTYVCTYGLVDWNKDCFASYKKTFLSFKLCRKEHDARIWRLKTHTNLLDFQVETYAGQGNSAQILAS